MRNNQQRQVIVWKTAIPLTDFEPLELLLPSSVQKLGTASMTPWQILDTLQELLAEVSTFLSFEEVLGFTSH
jgi:hypothetical protein